MPSPSRPSLSPLLKWAGGKRTEIPILKQNYPENIRRVIEPFSGGAAVAFDLNADCTVLNDVNLELAGLYRTMQDPVATQAMLDVVATIDSLRKRIKKTAVAIDAAQMKAAFKDPEPLVDAHFAAWTKGQAIPAIVLKALKADIKAQIKSKALTRIPALEKKHTKKFSLEEKRKHVETAFQAGVYTTLRRIYNGRLAATDDWKGAAWWIVRALCYSGMFRYGKNGDFNIPYGGIGYNSRDFASSIKYLQSPEIVDFFARAQVHSLDFEALMAHYAPFEEGDFIFVDPPYDSAFSKYNADGEFGQDEQRQLATVLRETQAPWMLVIKNTPFILSLYEGEGLWRGGFGKKYGVNFRNRFDRSVEHLVVTNYPLQYAEDDEVGILALP